MAKIVPGRFTADVDAPVVVFLIGMRINRLRAVRKWLPVMSAMPRMLATLYRHPEKGFLGGQTFVTWRGVMMIQYWRSVEDLMRFAHSPDEPHLGPWRRFMKEVGGDGTVGIWHETYVVEPGRAEAIYANMPVFGLAAATRHVPATGRRATARQRLGQPSGDSAQVVYTSGLYSRQGEHVRDEGGEAVLERPEPGGAAAAGVPVPR